MKIEALKLAQCAAPQERRQWPRVHFVENVDVYLADDAEPLPARLADLSVGGMQLRCSREQAAEWSLRPGELAGTGHCRARWIIALDDTRLELETECRRSYAVKTRDGEIALGFEFIHLDGASQRQLADCLLRHLEPADARVMNQALSPSPGPH